MARPLKDRNFSKKERERLDRLKRKIRVIGSQKNVAKLLGVTDRQIGRWVNWGVPVKKIYLDAIERLYQNEIRRKK